MKRTFLFLVVILLVASLAWAANNRVAVSDNATTNATTDISLDNEQPVAGLAMAIKFAEPGSDVMLTSADFTGTRLEYIKTLREAIIDNDNKTLLIYAIPIENEDHLAAGTGAIVKLSFTGKDPIKLETTTISHQEGISLVSADAKEMNFEVNFGEILGRGSLPTTYSIAQNYPNPFNASTVIKYALPQDAKVRIEIFNILGQKVRTLVDEVQTAGYRTVEWDGTNAGRQQVASGIYFYRIQIAGKFTEVKQMTLLK